MISVAPENTKAAAPSAYVRRLTEEFGTQRNLSIIAGGEGISATTVVLTDPQKGGGLSVSLPPQKWTANLEREFLQLAELSALDAITPEQTAQLSRLQGFRRILRHPRSGEEVLREYEERQVTRDLLAALHKYVRFHTPKDNPWASAEENLYAGQLP